MIAGLFTLIFAFYMIGKNKNLFGSDFTLKARFASVNGLIEGDNVLFSGIQAGTVKSIRIISDTAIEVELELDKKIKPYIGKGAIAAIGSEGLMGDKVVNITPGKGPSHGQAEDGDIIASRKIAGADEMLETLSRTNNNIADISASLKTTVMKLNESKLWSILNDPKVAGDIRSTLKSIKHTSSNAAAVSVGLHDLIGKIQRGKGAAGVLLSDTAFAANLTRAVERVKQAGVNADKLMIQLNTIAADAGSNLNRGKGTAALLLNDTLTAKNLAETIENVKKGTSAFNEDMEALKHSFLLRGYFKKLEKQQRKARADSIRSKTP